MPMTENPAAISGAIKLPKRAAWLPQPCSSTTEGPASPQRQMMKSSLPLRSFTRWARATIGASAASTLRRGGVRNRRNASRPASGTLIHCKTANNFRRRRCRTGETPGTTRPRTGLRRSSMAQVYESRIQITDDEVRCRVLVSIPRGPFMKPIHLLALTVLAARAANAGVYVEMVDHDIKTDKSTLAQKMYVQNGNGRFVDAEGHATLIKNNTFYIIDDADKSYVAVDKATMEQ